MSKPIIEVENLSKLYHLGELGSNSLREAAERLWKQTSSAVKPNNTFWALKDVSFTVNPGEIVGVIGANGAGKSTLLKVLSRITEPTAGKAVLRGRVASLLEVGTGFHPELTGRDNIYLNGSILGMRKKEIDKKFDEIVAFAELEKFLDTPVKHYSSGMYVRLGFAVAAHLEPEILLVDEVLAVGDLAFQKKCLGKINDVAKLGRTILFVSHNVSAILSICGRCLMLGNGKIIQQGSPSDVILSYSKPEESHLALMTYADANAPGDETARLISASVGEPGLAPAAELDINRACTVKMRFKINSAQETSVVPSYHFYTADGACAFVATMPQELKLSSGIYEAQCLIPANFLNDKMYSIGFALTSVGPHMRVNFFESHVLSLIVRDPIEGTVGRHGYTGPLGGVVRPQFEWKAGSA